MLDIFFSKFSTSRVITVIGPFTKNAEFIKVVEPIIFVDAGSRFRKNGEGLSLGDGDSFNGQLDLKLPVDKNYSDLSFALEKIPSHFSHISLIGFLGGRKDHELINLAVVHRFLAQRKNRTKAVFSTDIIALSAGSWSLEINGIFSLFSFENTSITVGGECKYELNENDKFDKLSSQGLSNIGFGPVAIDTTAPVFVFL